MATEELAKKLQRRLMLQISAEDANGEMVENNNYLEIGGGTEGRPVRRNTDTELSVILSRRLDINEGTKEPKQNKVFNPYTEFKEFTRKQIKEMEKMFKLYDSGKDGFIDLMELKLMMEKLGAPQTHIGLKKMIKEVDEDFDGKLNFREFLLIFHKAAAGELEEDSGLMALARLSEIDVSTEGVQGAKHFFEAKAQALTTGSRFEAEIKAENERRKRIEEDRKQRRAAFKELKAAFM
ncbi:EF-hand domain-containing protein D1 isoform X1 [Hemiscyllium ocellatum]|uniref:EF-hand domain-containing protein D1 isoform X1 n=1 Tax=Hemiscyllium ocellatum TaxID=170820 RepID=UPI002966866F|nr:EF-hand domain-containing protein D1 isoform X1 [Hemiscyllium ocellatum]